MKLIKKHTKKNISSSNFVPNRSIKIKELITTHSNYPTNVLVFDNDTEKLHPTQKPTSLFDYIIKTYTLQKERVLDFTSGSGTTAISCINTNRKYICVEKDKDYFNKSINRIENHIKQKKNI